MSDAATSPNPAVYQLRVVMVGISPLIWRRLLIPADTTIAGLHTVLQTAFGWGGEHLHRFVIHGTEYGISCVGGSGFRDDARQVRLGEFGLRLGERFTYEYNWGAGWLRSIAPPIRGSNEWCRSVSWRRRSRRSPTRLSGLGSEPGRAELPGVGGAAEVLPAAGYFPKLADVPVVVINHVRTALGLAEDVPVVHESDRTLWRHRDYVRDRLNVVYKPAEARAIAEKAIRKAVTTKDNPADLINVALEELVRARRELPGFTTLDKMVSAIRTETNKQLFGLVATRLDAADRRRLARLLWVDSTSKRSKFDLLKTPAKAASLGKFKLRLAHLQALDELGATEQWLDGIPATKMAHFAGEARVTDVGDMRDIGEAKRWTLLASLIHECRTTARDEDVYRILSIPGQASRRR